MEERRYLNRIRGEFCRCKVSNHVFWSQYKDFRFKEHEFELVVEVQETVELLKDGIDLVTDSDKVLLNLLSYPLHATLAR